MTTKTSTHRLSRAQRRTAPLHHLLRTAVPSAVLVTALGLSGCSSSSPDPAAASTGTGTSAGSTRPSSSPVGTSSTSGPSGTAGATSTPGSPGSAPAAGSGGAPGSTPSGSTSPGPLPAPRSATVPAPGATVDGAGFGRDVVTAMKAARSGHATLTLGSGGQTSSYAMQFAYGADGTLRSRAIGSGPLGASEVVVIGTTTYTKVAQPVGGRSWSKSTDPTSAALADPTAIVQGFAESRVVHVGPQGNLQHYTLTSGGKGGGTVQAYVDGLGRPVSMEGEGAGLAIKISYSDWGTPVTVTEPPADQVLP